MRLEKAILDLSFGNLITQYLDTFTTIYGISYCDLVETNPFWGTPVIFFKLLVPWLIIGISYWVTVNARKSRKLILLFFLVITVFALSIVVINNFFLIAQVSL